MSSVYRRQQLLYRRTPDGGFCIRVCLNCRFVLAYSFVLRRFALVAMTPRVTMMARIPPATRIVPKVIQPMTSKPVAANTLVDAAALAIAVAVGFGVGVDVGGMTVAGGVLLGVGLGVAVGVGVGLGVGVGVGVAVGFGVGVGVGVGVVGGVDMQ